MRRGGWGCPACKAAQDLKRKVFTALAANAGKESDTVERRVERARLRDLDLRRRLGVGGADGWERPVGKRVALATPAHVHLGQCVAVGRGGGCGGCAATCTTRCDILMVWRRREGLAVE